MKVFGVCWARVLKINLKTYISSICQIVFEVNMNSWYIELFDWNFESFKKIIFVLDVVFLESFSHIEGSA